MTLITTGVIAFNYIAYKSEVRLRQVAGVLIIVVGMGFFFVTLAGTDASKNLK